MDPPQPSEPSLFVLPVLTGHVDNFDAIPAKVRDLVKYRGSAVGPWLFDPREHHCSVWEWVARNGLGDSCRDARILDEFVEVVLAYHPETGTMGALVWAPSTRSTFNSDSVMVNQVLSFISAHLADPKLTAAVRSPQIRGATPELTYATGAFTGQGAGVALGLDELARNAYGRALQSLGLNALFGMDPQFLKEHPDDLFPKGPPPAPSISLFVADWLDLLLKDPSDGPDAEFSPPQDSEELYERLALVHGDIFNLDPEEEPRDWAFVMTLDALFARVIDRTNELRRLYRRHADTWPEIPPLLLLYPTAHVTFCLTTPDLARLGAALPCEQCEGCEVPSDLTLVDQLGLDLAS